ncbi:hypothetical protein I6F37_44050 [Bradyrhizobium sp. NBAIM08]|nr:hypothetical protein [Bradyrhizobium sp. NBAIM08]
MTEPSQQPVRAPRVQREVTSFVRRSTRMRPVHLRAWERLRHAYVLEVPQQAISTSIAPGHPLDIAAAFGRTAPLVVERASYSSTPTTPWASGTNSLAVPLP